MRAILLLMTVISFAACAPTRAQECTGVCVSVKEEDGRIYVGIANGSPDFISLPWIIGVESLEYEFYLASNAARRPSTAPASEIGSPLGSALLAPGGWYGFSVEEKYLQDVFELEDGCQEIEVAFRIKDRSRDQSIYGGVIQRAKIDLCV